MGAWAEPVFAPVVPALAPREPREAIPVIAKAAPAMPTVARVTPWEDVDFPFSIWDTRQETVSPLAPTSVRVAEPSSWRLVKRTRHKVRQVLRMQLKGFD